VGRREWIDDARRAAVYTAVGVLLILIIPEATNTWNYTDDPVPPPPAGVCMAVLAFACLGLVVRRTHPVTCLMVATLAVLTGPLWLSSMHMAVSLVLGEALYCAVLFSTRRVSLTVTVGTCVFVALIVLASLASGGTKVAVLTLLGLSLLLIPVVWAREVRHHQEDAAAQRERAESARRAAVAAERARMARDLHDVIAGQLSAIAIQSEAALTLPDQDPATQRRLLEAVRRGSVAALAEMRTMIGLLRADGSADGEPLTAPAGLDRLDQLLTAGRASGLRIDVDDRRPPDTPLPAAVDLAAYRIVQESLTNAAKHAPGGAVTLRLVQADATLTVELSNPLPATGTGPMGGGTGTGLLGLRERAVAVGGTLRAAPAGGRWTVLARLPIAAPDGPDVVPTAREVAR
jgi:signal transduction histidine kinase